MKEGYKNHSPSKNQFNHSSRRLRRLRKGIKSTHQYVTLQLGTTIHNAEGIESNYISLWKYQFFCRFLALLIAFSIIGKVDCLFLIVFQVKENI